MDWHHTLDLINTCARLSADTVLQTTRLRPRGSYPQRVVLPLCYPSPTHTSDNGWCVLLLELKSLLAKLCAHQSDLALLPPAILLDEHAAECRQNAADQYQEDHGRPNPGCVGSAAPVRARYAFRPGWRVAKLALEGRHPLAVRVGGKIIAIHRGEWSPAAEASVHAASGHDVGERVAPYLAAHGGRLPFAMRSRPPARTARRRRAAVVNSEIHHHAFKCLPARVNKILICENGRR